MDITRSGLQKIEQIELSPLHDMRVLEGPLDQLLKQGLSDPNRDDYLLVRLSDTHAILDIMGKLRAVYPNVLHLERPGLMSTGEQRTLHRDQLKRGEMAMFQDFYQQICGDVLTAEQTKVIAEILESIHNEERD